MAEQGPAAKVRTAFHEAAHAVAAHVLELGVLEVHILKDGKSLGKTYITVLEEMCSALEEGDRSSGTRLKVETYIIVLLAGTAIEYVLRRGRRSESPYAPSGGDWKAAEQLAACVTDSKLECHTYMAWLWVRTCELIASNTPAVNAVAGELLRVGRVSGEEVGRIASEAMRDAAKNQKDGCQLPLVGRIEL